MSKPNNSLKKVIRISTVQIWNVHTIKRDIYVYNRIINVNTIKTIGVNSFSFEGFQTKFENKDKNDFLVAFFLIILLYDVSVTRNHYQVKILFKVTRANFIRYWN